MHLKLMRTHRGATSILGRILSPTFNCYSLEPLPSAAFPCIPPGVRVVTVEKTHNPRLWTPDERRLLPHLWGVPNREGIEMHAGNHATDTLGCIIVGFGQQADSVTSSRDALVALLLALVNAGEPHSIEVVQDPSV